MRTSLPRTRPNGHGPEPGQVFVVSGMCAEPRFRPRFDNVDANDFCMIYLGAAQFGAEADLGAAETGEQEDPHFILRRYYDQRQAVAILRVDWDGIFTLFANDDACADQLFQEVVQAGGPEEVRREWSTDPATLRMFGELLYLA